jgi:hypothetical protein
MFCGYVSENQYIALGEYSPEKAGVGGSTPSLATTFSITCTSRVSLLRCNWFLTSPSGID